VARRGLQQLKVRGPRLVPARDQPVDGEEPALAPGQTLEVDINGDPSNDAALRRYWGLNRLVLPDAGGAVRVQTFDSITLACDAWGSGSC
jgi:hypothetical protein